MEVDILSPQMRMRSISSSNKRARSPGSPNPLERASKRQILVQRESMSALSCNLEANQNGWEGRRRPLFEDEWVHQTRGMTIRSPGFVETVQSSNSENESLDEDARGDVHMTGPEDASRHTFHQDLPSTPTTAHPSESEDSTMKSLTNSQEPGSQPHSHHRSLQSDPAPPSSLDLPSSEAALNSLHALLDSHSHQQMDAEHQHQPHRAAPPRITLHPATPSTPSDGCRLSYMLSLSQPSTPPPLTLNSDAPSSPMSVVAETSAPSTSSPSSSHSNCKNYGQRRRPFVSMGPRADCEKCRLKVPGHWMHFD